ncbi:MAG: methionine adenosyltransferase domain-containing protein, partial [Phycisphaerales bacterium]
MNTASDHRPTDILRPAEFVLPGHPDKLADAIADRIVCAAYRRERRALVGVEVAVHRNVVFIDGRVACRDAESIDFACIAKDVYRSVGYCGRFPPAPHRLRVRTDLALGPLLPGEAEFREVSDDQSIVTGYACSTPGTDMLPVEQAMVKRLARALDSLRRSAKELALGPDGKVLVLVREDIDRPDAPPRWSLEQVTVSIQHAADWDALAAHAAIDARLRREAAALAAVVPGLSIAPTLDLRINPVGDFVVGGPFGDNGLSGKKLVMDAYGPRVPIGGGATAGKDRWKVDRYGPKLARRMAVDAVLRRGYRECTVTLAISPGDRRFRIASIHGTPTPVDAASWAAHRQELEPAIVAGITSPLSGDT